MVHSHLPGEEPNERVGPFHSHSNTRVSRIVTVVLQVIMFALMLGLGCWEISMFDMNSDELDSSQCKIVQIRNVMLANGIIDVVSALLSLLMIVFMTTLFSPKMSNILFGTVAFGHGLFTLASLALMITNSVMVWSNRCSDAQPHFYQMVSVMYIVMWSLLAAYVVTVLVLTAIGRGVDIIRAAKKDGRYEVLATAEQ